MEIIVEGVGYKYFTPNQIILNFNFVTKGKSYEEVLEKGSSNVELFIDGILLQSGFSKNDCLLCNKVLMELFEIFIVVFTNINRHIFNTNISCF